MAGRDAEVDYWLALHRAPGVGNRVFRDLLERFGSPRQVFEATASQVPMDGMRSQLLQALREPDWDGVERDRAWLAQPGHHCLPWEDSRYPELLRAIPDPPCLLFVAGDPDVLALRQVALVGSRSPTPAGERFARELARNLVDQGYAVTSGLALGIDAAAHRGALEGGGVTLAVAGIGPEQVYPQRHLALAEQILAEGGALITEFPTGTPPQPANFPRRNRIISGLGLGVVVVEAALRSGSLITARMALEQGREVFAVPGFPGNPMARGCNVLIKQGAKLVEGVEDILEELGGLFRPVPMGGNEPVQGLDPQQQEILKHIACAPTSVDTLVAATGNTPEVISSCLLILELQGHVVSTSGGCYSRTR